MSETADELKAVKDFLSRLESGEMRLIRSGKDVTQNEIAILRREIAFLEKILARLKGRT